MPNIEQIKVGTTTYDIVDINARNNINSLSNNLGDLAFKDKVSWSTDINNIPSTFPPSTHNHDDRYYTETEINTLLDEKIDIISKTTSGSLVHITDAGVYPVNNLTINIEPVQDLHGYDHPWPAGGGKNLWEFEKWLTDLGVTYSKSENVYTVTIAQALYSTPYYFATDDPTVSVSVKSFTKGTASNIRIKVYDYSGTSVGSIIAGTSTYLDNKNASYVRFDWANGDSGKTFTIEEPQIELSATHTSYAPYSNICSIAGWTDTNITRTGKNLTDLDEINLGGSNPRTINKYFNTIPAGTYTFSANLSGEAIFRIELLNNNKHIITTQFDNGNNKTITVNEPFNRFYCFISTSDYSANKTASITNFQLELGSIATTYEPYQGTTYPISWSTQAGTVYGGSLNVTTGELTVDWKSVDLGTSTWRYSSSSSFKQRFTTTLDDAKIPNLNTQKANIICSIYKTESDSDVGSLNNNLNCVIALNRSNYLYIADNNYTDTEIFKSAMSGVQLVYELAEPVTYQLTPTEVTTLLGINNIWADTGDIKLLNYRLPEYEIFLNNLPIATTTNAGIITEAPADGNNYSRKNNNWEVIKYGYDEINFTSTTTGTNYNWDDNNIIFDRTNLNYIPIYILNENTGNTLAATFTISTSTITYTADEKFSGVLFVMRKNN